MARGWWSRDISGAPTRVILGILEASCAAPSARSSRKSSESSSSRCWNNQGVTPFGGRGAITPFGGLGAPAAGLFGGLEAPPSHSTAGRNGWGWFQVGENEAALEEGDGHGAGDGMRGVLSVRAALAARVAPGGWGRRHDTGPPRRFPRLRPESAAVAPQSREYEK